MEMDLCSRISADKFLIIFKVCVSTNKGEGDQLNVDRSVTAGGERGQKSLRTCGNPLWMAPNASLSADSGNHYTNTPRLFHVKTTWKQPFPRCFSVKYTWCVCRI